MSVFPTPRLHLNRAQLLFWIAACVVAFTLAYGLGTVWIERRTVQEGWIPTSTYHLASYP